MLSTADARQAKELQKRCFDFIMKHFGKVIGTQSFTELPKHLLEEVLFAASKRGLRALEFGVLYKVHTTLSSLVNNIFSRSCISLICSLVPPMPGIDASIFSLSHSPGVRRNVSDKSASVFLFFALATLFQSSVWQGACHRTVWLRQTPKLVASCADRHFRSTACPILFSLPCCAAPVPPWCLNLCVLCLYAHECCVHLATLRAEIWRKLPLSVLRKRPKECHGYRGG